MPTVAKRKKRLILSREVKAFAKERGLTPYLPKLVEVLHSICADATRMGAEVHHDPEIAGLSWLLFEVEVPWKTSAQAMQANKAWYRATAEACPKPLLMEFTLLIRRRP
ncbi:MAG: hypothetical protein L0Y71_04045 [Gemmataceae bacterium]|nr:hypothetical protein [Gemmataceae bacterium]